MFRSAAIREPSASWVVIFRMRAASPAATRTISDCSVACAVSPWQVVAICWVDAVICCVLAEICSAIAADSSEDTRI